MPLAPPAYATPRGGRLRIGLTNAGVLGEQDGEQSDVEERTADDGDLLAQALADAEKNVRLARHHDSPSDVPALSAAAGSFEDSSVVEAAFAEVPDSVAAPPPYTSALTVSDAWTLGNRSVSWAKDTDSTVRRRPLALSLPPSRRTR
jgi:hypothetical protein